MPGIKRSASAADPTAQSGPGRSLGKRVFRRYDFAIVPTIDLSDDEHAAAAVRRTLDEDRFPHSPRLTPLRSALAKLEPSSVPKPVPPSKPLPQASRARGKGTRR